MSTELDWKTGVPAEVGLYFVALQYGEAAGVFDFLNWDGKQWCFDNPGVVVAYVTLQDFKNSLDIKWPFDETLNYQRKILPEDDDELWSEA